MNDKINLSHGDGGTCSQLLIKDVFYKYFNDPSSGNMPDSFVFQTDSCQLAYTTDSFVVKPLFFRGGDIGKLAVCGTINDLAASGALPLYISAGFILEEGFSMEKLCSITKSMGEVCRNTGARIVTGDTKVVEKGSADGVFINTSGIGMVSRFYAPRQVEPGDELIITGGIGEHGTSILIERYELGIETKLESDCGPMCSLLSSLGEGLGYVKLMKDPTRGGLATALNEIAIGQGLSIELNEECIPVKREVQAINDILGIDPLYLACEGRMILIVQRGYGNQLLQHVKKLNNCLEARIMGRFTPSPHSLVYMNTSIGGKRILPKLEGQMLPRIC